MENTTKNIISFETLESLFVENSHVIVKVFHNDFMLYTFGEVQKVENDCFYVDGNKFYKNDYNAIKLLHVSKKEIDENDLSNWLNVSNVLENGVIRYDLEKLGVINDYDEADKQNECHSILCNECVEDMYEERVKFNGLGTYQVKIGRIADFEEFMAILKKDCEYRYFHNKENENHIGYYELYKDLLSISMQEWQSGKINGQRFGKWLRKQKVSQDVIDFYSAQIKDEKTVYLTISDYAQHINGMSYYAEDGTWNGYGGTSCQNQKYDNEMSLSLCGSLADEKLFIAMLHYNLEDIEDMTDNLKARTMLRWVNIEGRPVLISTYYYGNVNTKNELNEALKQLHEVGIYEKEIREGYTVSNTEHLKHSATHYIRLYDEVDVIETILETVTIECPMCDCDHEIEVYSDVLDREVYVTCPLCHGEGEIEQDVYIEVESTVEVEDEKECKPYAEGYHHHGNSITIEVNENRILSDRKGLREALMNRYSELVEA